MDNLTMDAVAAHQAGMTYGKWKAMQKPVAPIRVVPTGFAVKTCPICGNEFMYRNNRQRLYCGDVCKSKQNYRRMRERKMANG